jgi:hypothetical protein
MAATSNSNRAPRMCGKGSPISVSIAVTEEDTSPYGSSFTYYVHTPETLTTSHTQDTITTNHRIYGHGLTLNRVWLLALRHALRVLNKRRTLRSPNEFSAVIGIVRQDGWLTRAYNYWLPWWKCQDFQRQNHKLLYEVSLR